MFTGKTYWVVGASEGLGREIAAALDRAGARVALSARTGDRLHELVATLSDASAVTMDVTDAASVAAAAAAVGPVDGIVYAAGLYEPMSAGTWAPETAAAICDVNFTGAVRVLGHVVPDFVRRDSGHVVLIGSLAGFRGLPGAVGYGASKAALMHLGQSIHADVRGTGVRVQVVNPGFIRTRLTEKNDFAMPQIQTPDDAAAAVIAAMRSSRFYTSFPAPFAWLFRLAPYLPSPVFHRIFRRA